MTEMGPTRALKQQPKLKDNLKMRHDIMWNILTGPLLLMKENTECGLRTDEVHTPWTTCLSGFFHGLKGTAHLNNQPGHRGTHLHTQKHTDWLSCTSHFRRKPLFIYLLYVWTCPSWCCCVVSESERGPLLNHWALLLEWDYPTDLW